MQDIGVMSLLTIIRHFVFIALSFNAFQSLRLDRYFTQERQNKFKVALVLFSVAVGYGVSSFFLSFLNSLTNMTYLIK